MDPSIDKRQDVNTEKGHHVTCQLNLFNMMIETRILMQKVDPQEAQTADLAEMIQAFVELKQVLCEQYPFAINFNTTLNQNGKRIIKPTSTTEEIMAGVEMLWNELLSIEQQFTPLTNQIIEKWTTKIQMANPEQAKFKSINTSTLSQITHLLADKERLVKRSQLDRLNSDSQVYDEELYNDIDFYQVLLKDLIESKITDPDDPIATSMKIIQLKQLQDKKKRKKSIDTRASKGRKVRYDAQEKLMNFMAPIPNGTWHEEMKDELFKTLFGNGADNSSNEFAMNVVGGDGFRIM